MRSAGCIINDLWDRKIDAQIERTKNRPLVTGLVSTKEAYIYLIILLFLSLLILLSLSIFAIKIAFFAFILALFYPYMKRITFFPQIFLGITYNMGLVIGYVSMTNSLNLIVFLAYIGFIFWTLTYDTIYAFLDIEDDKKIGVKSLAIILENRDYKAYLYFFSFIFIILCVMTEMLIKQSYYIYMTIFPAFTLLYLIYSLDIKDRYSCIKKFKMNSLVGWLMLLGCL
jgi:4-hydroxybenzoate polyprenyl transferase